MTLPIKKWLREQGQRGQQTAQRWFLDYNQQHASIVKRLYLLAWIAIIGLPLYYVVWTYWFPQPYENLGLRLFGMLLCLPALFARHFSQQKWLPVYFFVGLTYVLPFFFTFMYLMNQGSAVWSESLLIALILLFHFDTALALLSYLCGTALAYFLAMQLLGLNGVITPAELAQWPIQLFAILTVSLAKVGRRVLSEEKRAGISTALATVAHELRTPLLSIDANNRGIKRLLAEASTPPRLGQAISRIDIELRHMNNAIDLLLLNSSHDKRRWQAQEILSMTEAAEAMLQRYPFANQSQRERVTLDSRSDFHFRGNADLAAMILLNLMNNALKALHRAGKGNIRLIVDGRHRRLYFLDTGCGIEPNHLINIFKQFYCYPAHSGTGIGLAFCREVLTAWEAKIHCKSKSNTYTLFVLEFPPVLPD